MNGAPSLYLDILWRVHIKSQILSKSDWELEFCLWRRTQLNFLECTLAGITDDRGMLFFPNGPFLLTWMIRPLVRYIPLAWLHYWFRNSLLNLSLEVTLTLSDFCRPNTAIQKTDITRKKKKLATYMTGWWQWIRQTDKLVHFLQVGRIKQTASGTAKNKKNMQVITNSSFLVWKVDRRNLNQESTPWESVFAREKRVFL